MFLRNGPTARHVYSYAATEHDEHNSRDSHQILFNDKDQQVLIVSCAPGAKSVVYDCLVINFSATSLATNPQQIEPMESEQTRAESI